MMTLGCQPEAPADQVGSQDWIAFHSMRDQGAFNIFLVHADSGRVVALTSDTLWSYHPIWWGDTLSYVGTQTDGSPIRMGMQMEAREAFGLLPSFKPDILVYPSPDGERLAYHREVDSVLQIFVADRLGKAERQLTYTKGGNSHPRWSPDGRQMVFRSMRDGNPEIYRMNANGKMQTRLTESDSLDRYAQWSPLGDRIAFASKRDGDDLEIYTMDLSGKDIKRLTDNEVSDEELCWSPDGKRLAFHSLDDQGNHDIYVMNADGSGRKRMTDHPAYEGFPQWAR